MNEHQLIMRLKEISENKRELKETALLRIKTCLFDVKSQYTHTVSEKDIKHLFKNDYVTLVVFTFPDNFPPQNIYHQLKLYFDIYYTFAQGGQHICLLNPPTPIEYAQLREILNTTGLSYTTCVGISSVHSVKDFVISVASPKSSSLYLEALMDLVVSILPVSQNEAATLRRHIFTNHCDYALVMDVKQAKADISDYIERLHQETDCLETAYAKSFTEITMYYLAVSAMRADRKSIEYTYGLQQQKILDYQSLSSLIKEMFSHAWNYQSESEKEAVIYSEKIYKAILYIKKHFKDDLPLDEAALYVNLHPSYFSHIFKKEVGISFLQYLNKIRIETACTLLLDNSNLTIEAISQMVGFHTTTYFHKTFRSQMGISPNRWRRDSL